MKGRGIEWTIGVVGSLVIAGALLLPGLPSSGPRHMNESSAFRSLEAVGAAQMMFRSQTKGYWRDDVAGLYFAKGPDGKPLKLIELSIAAADSRPQTKFDSEVVASWKAGYWYRALRFVEETSPDPERFAVCAYPDAPTAGKWMYLLSERGVCYRKSFQGASLPAFFPEDPEKEGWEKRAATDKY